MQLVDCQLVSARGGPRRRIHLEQQLALTSLRWSRNGTSSHGRSPLYSSACNAHPHSPAAAPSSIAYHRIRVLGLQNVHWKVVSPSSSLHLMSCSGSMNASFSYERQDGHVIDADHVTHSCTTEDTADRQGTHALNGSVE